MSGYVEPSEAALNLFHHHLAEAGLTRAAIEQLTTDASDQLAALLDVSSHLDVTEVSRLARAVCTSQGPSR
jgi:hypothetical protein